jgi:hypothetical protein
MPPLAVFTAIAVTLATCPVRGAEPIPLPFKTFSLRVPVESRQVELKVSGTASAVDKGDSLDVHADIVVDLADLRAQIGDIVRAKTNRNDDCGDRLDVHTVDLRATPPTASLTASAHYERWACGLGIKTRLLEQNGDLTLRLTPVVSGDTVAMNVDLIEARGDGGVGALLRDAVLGPWLIDEMRALFPKQLTVANIRDGLPTALRDIPATLDRVSITDGGNGRPAISGAMHLVVPADKVLALLQQLPKP